MVKYFQKRCEVCYLLFIYLFDVIIEHVLLFFNYIIIISKLQEP